MNINSVEWVWLSICVLGVIATIILLLDSLGERALVKTLFNGKRKVRHIIVRANIRRESMRLVMQLLLTGAVIPSLFRPGDFTFVFDLSTDASRVLTAVTVAVLCLMAVPLLLLATSLADKRDRGTLRDLAIQVVREEGLVTNDEIVALIATESLKADRRGERADEAIERSDAAIERGDAAIERADAVVERANKTLGGRRGTK